MAMMQSSESSDEQEIVFDEQSAVEETNDNGGSIGSIGTRHSDTMNGPFSDPLRNFQPLLLAGHSAARHLESFLSSPHDDDNDATSGAAAGSTTDISGSSTNDVTAAATNASTTTTSTAPITTGSFDPYSSPHRLVADASLLDTTPDDCDDDYSDDDNEAVNLTTGNDTTTTTNNDTVTVTAARMPHIPGSAGFLEMEQEPPRTPSPAASRHSQHASANGIYDPIKTSSGLLLTHRRVPLPPIGPLPLPVLPVDTMESLEQHQRTRPKSLFELEGGKQKQSNNRTHSHHSFPHAANTGHGHYPQSTSPYTPYTSSYTTPRAFRKIALPPILLRYVRLAVVVSALVLITGTAVLVHHAWSGGSDTTGTSTATGTATDTDTALTGTNSAMTQPKLSPVSDTSNLADATATATTNFDLIPLGENGDFPDHIILLPFPPDYHQYTTTTHNVRHNPARHRRLEPLRQQRDRNRLVGIQAFPDEEMEQQRPRLEQTHNKRRPPKLPHMDMLPSVTEPLIALHEEFQAWMQRHNKTYHSSQEHHYRFNVWSDNHLKTAVKNERHGPCQMTGKAVFGSTHTQDLTADEFKSKFLNGYNLKREPSLKGDEPTHPNVLDPSIVAPNLHPEVQKRLLKQQQEQQGPLYSLNYRAGCKWYDVSCHLRYIFSTYLYGMGGTMEPRYDADSYPTAVDWRSLGAVTEVHSQGSCGACWAITAVETAESAYFIAKGTLYDLAETEVIVCAGCELCAGGWPQDAFDYIIRNNGLPLESVMPYSADYLLLVSEQVAGTSDELNSDTVKAYQKTTCPSGGNGGGGGGGNSGDAAVVSGSNTYSRFGKIKGYGYSTSKCVCYTDGSGCDCDKQNEGYAVRNVATYGPAVVCLDASTWQDYTEGIITSDSGCSSGFMDVNHCVQAVGYAYLSEGEEARDGSGDKGSSSRSGSGSKDSSQRQGYWIVRNQWSKYWGMNGYAYVAMGDNTCGILNDMLQAYT